MPKLIEAIESEVPRGDGVESPLRLVRQYHTPQGDFLAENDPLNYLDDICDDCKGHMPGLELN